jgi:hypothetical protein
MPQCSGAHSPSALNPVKFVNLITDVLPLAVWPLGGARRRTGLAGSQKRLFTVALVKNGGVPFVRAFSAKVPLRFCFYKENRMLGPRESGIIDEALTRL